MKRSHYCRRGPVCILLPPVLGERRGSSTCICWFLETMSITVAMMSAQPGPMQPERGAPWQSALDPPETSPVPWRAESHGEGLNGGQDNPIAFQEGQT